MSATENIKINTTSIPVSPERVTVVPTDPAQLAAAVKTQVEYYFSKENLKNDAFLLSKMDAQNSVAVSTILTFAKLKALTQDEAVVLSALQGSSVVSVADGRLKSCVKQGGRNTIILREIPADTPEEDIREIFNYPGCKPLTSVKSDIGDTWFVVMANEADAKDAILDLKLKKRTFNGTSVKARLKSEAVVNRSHYPTKPPIASSVYPVMYPYGGAPMDMQQFGGYVGNSQSVSGEGSPQSRGDEGHSGGSNSGGKNNMRSDRGEGGGGAGGSNSAPKGEQRRANTVKTGGASREGGGRGGGDAGNRKANNNNGNSSSGGGNRGSRDGQRSSPRETPAIEINSMNFPPLPPQGPGGEDTGTTGTSASTTPTASATATVVAAEPVHDFSILGYGDKAYAKYQIDDIINIVKNIKEAVLPDTIHTTQHPLAMEVAPNVDLLLRQRTFSIDETREQMQQGRPVQRDAVISGEVDYNSVMYGEDTSSENQAGANKPKQQAPVPKKASGSWAGVLKSSAAVYAPPPVAAKAPATRPGAPGAKPEAGKGKTEASGKKDAAASSAGGAKSKGPASSSSGGRKDDKGRAGEKKDGRGSIASGGGQGQRNGGGRRSEQKEKEPAGPPLKWGDKPSFANILKAKEESATTSSSSPTKTATATASTAAPAQSQGTQRSQRSRSGSESSTGKAQIPSAEDGMWSKQKLPPVKKNEP